MGWQCQGCPRYYKDSTPACQYEDCPGKREERDTEPCRIIHELWEFKEPSLKYITTIPAAENSNLVGVGEKSTENNGTNWGALLDTYKDEEKNKEEEDIDFSLEDYKQNNDSDSGSDFSDLESDFESDSDDMNQESSKSVSSSTSADINMIEMDTKIDIEEHFKEMYDVIRVSISGLGGAKYYLVGKNQKQTIIDEFLKAAREELQDRDADSSSESSEIAGHITANPWLSSLRFGHENRSAVEHLLCYEVYAWLNAEYIPEVANISDSVIDVNTWKTWLSGRNEGFIMEGCFYGFLSAGHWPNPRYRYVDGEYIYTGGIEMTKTSYRMVTKGRDRVRETFTEDIGFYLLDELVYKLENAYDSDMVENAFPDMDKLLFILNK